MEQIEAIEAIEGSERPVLNWHHELFQVEQPQMESGEQPRTEAVKRVIPEEGVNMMNDALFLSQCAVMQAARLKTDQTMAVNVERAPELMNLSADDFARAMAVPDVNAVVPGASQMEAARAVAKSAQASNQAVEAALHTVDQPEPLKTRCDGIVQGIVAMANMASQIDLQLQKKANEIEKLNSEIQVLNELDEMLMRYEHLESLDLDNPPEEMAPEEAKRLRELIDKARSLGINIESYGWEDQKSLKRYRVALERAVSMRVMRNKTNDIWLQMYVQAQQVLFLIMSNQAQNQNETNRSIAQNIRR